MSQNPAPVILSVDDNPTNLELLFRMLGDEGFEVLFAEDGESALARASEVRPDLILLDVGMPGLDGFETCRRLKAEPRTAEIPVIFLTGYADTGDKVKGFRLGAVDYVTKPLQYDEVLVRVRTHLSIARLERELRERNDELRRELAARQEAEERRRRVEERIHDAQKLESLAALARGAAQEFDHLLSGLVTHAELAALELPPRSTARGALAQVELAARRASDLARQMLAYAGASELRFRSVALPELIEETRPLLAVGAGRRAIEYEVDPATPAVSGDPTLLRQVLLNLVTNAVEAMEGRDGPVRVRVGPAEGEPEAVSIAVADTGAGMDEAVRARVFDPFFTTKLPGRGLGLAAALGIVRSHGGSIAIDSAPGAGTRVAVRLPLAGAGAPVSPGAPAARAPR